MALWKGKNVVKDKPIELEAKVWEDSDSEIYL